MPNERLQFAARSLFGIIAAGLLAAGASLAKDPGRESGGAAGRDFGGIYITTLPLHDEKRNLPDSVYRLAAVDGIYVRLVWRTIEPAPGKYDWSTLDRETAR